MSTNSEIISKIVNYIENHIAEDLDLDRIAEISRYSKYHICRMFTNEVGCGIHQYIQRRRLTDAARQLIYTEKTIIEIAFATGYGSQQAFSLAFKRLYLESPQSYRRNKEFWPIQLKYVVNSKILQHKGKVSYGNFNIKCEVKVA
ncbi:AraC family transcriptional regulator [Clostridium subterminale]|uniref:AraC family transcriptional regulator n=1 Tax=Clostridium subterminale TaxID=1550 RepID=A0ABP3WAL4_CLOSU